MFSHRDALQRPALAALERIRALSACALLSTTTANWATPGAVPAARSAGRHPFIPAIRSGHPAGQAHCKVRRVS